MLPVAGALLTSVLALGACGEEKAPEKPAEASAGQPGTVDPNVPAFSGTCGGDCKADVAAGRAALERGDYRAALAAYRCADSPEAAFGAGLSRLVLTVEDPASATLLEDLGFGPISAADFVGKNGILSRLSARNVGAGSVTVGALAPEAGGAALSGGKVDFESGNSEQRETGRVANATNPDSSITVQHLEVENGTALTISYDCTSTYSSRRFDPRLTYLSASLTVGGREFSCSPPYQSGAQCESDGGTIHVVEAGALGSMSSYRLEDVLVECNDWDAPRGANGQPTSYFTRLNGTFGSVVVTPDVDTAGLHPLLSKPLARKSLPPATTVGSMALHASALSPALEEAACYFGRAAGGSGVVYTAPGVMWGGNDVEFRAGDAGVLEAGLLAASGFGQLLASADLPIPVRELACSDDDGVRVTPVGPGAGTTGSGGSAGAGGSGGVTTGGQGGSPGAGGSGGAAETCLSEKELTGLVNEGFAQEFRPERVQAAAKLTDQATAALERAIGKLDDTSLFVKNAVSSPGLAHLLVLTGAARKSLAGERTAVPFLTPAATANIAEFVATVKSPRSFGLPVLLWEESCDTFGCYGSARVNPDLADQFFGAASDVNWNGTYEFEQTADNELGDMLSETLQHAVTPFLRSKR